MNEHFRLCCILTQKEYEIAVGWWYALGMKGCEEIAHSDAEIEVNVYFSDSDAAAEAAAQLRHTILRSDAIAITLVDNEDWNARWRAAMAPVLLAPSWWAAPPWLPPQQQEPGDRWIKIEPKMAFGTGHHETTRLAAQMLIDSGPSIANGALLDIGAGSGVLCFVGAAAGASRCIGVEIDLMCRENLAENRLLNHCTRNVSFVIGPVDAISRGARFDIVVMNMIRTEAAPLLAACRDLLVQRGILVWSGILCDEKKLAISDAQAAGFEINREIVENEWWCGKFLPGQD